MCYLWSIHSESHCDVSHGVSSELNGQLSAIRSHWGTGIYRCKQTAGVSSRITVIRCLHTEFSSCTTSPSDVHLGDTHSCAYTKSQYLTFNGNIWRCTDCSLNRFMFVYEQSFVIKQQLVDLWALKCVSVFISWFCILFVFILLVIYNNNNLKKWTESKIC